VLHASIKMLARVMKQRYARAHRDSVQTCRQRRGMRRMPRFSCHAFSLMLFFIAADDFRHWRCRKTARCAAKREVMCYARLSPRCCLAAQFINIPRLPFRAHDVVSVRYDIAAIQSAACRSAQQGDAHAL